MFVPAPDHRRQEGNLWVADHAEDAEASIFNQPMASFWLTPARRGGGAWHRHWISRPGGWSRPNGDMSYRRPRPRSHQTPASINSIRTEVHQGRGERKEPGPGIRCPHTWRSDPSDAFSWATGRNIRIQIFDQTAVFIASGQVGRPTGSFLTRTMFCTCRFGSLAPANKLGYNPGFEGHSCASEALKRASENTSCLIRPVSALRGLHGIGRRFKRLPREYLWRHSQ